MSSARAPGRPRRALHERRSAAKARCEDCMAKAPRRERYPCDGIGAATRSLREGCRTRNLRPRRLKNPMISDLIANLGGGSLGFLVIAVALALGFEFINGFHDTANAVATVIYTHTLPARVA